MSRSEVEQGQAWIEERFKAIATGLKVDVTDVQWVTDAEDFRRGTTTLIFQAGGRRFVESIPLEHVEDIPGDEGVRGGMEQYLQTLAARAASCSK